MRKTIRFNKKEKADLELLKKTFNIDDDSKAVKLAVEWVNNYLNNVTRLFFPSSYDVILSKKLKTQTTNRKVYD